MSIVGTRPPLISETNLYELHHYARLAIKPGITGLWQVSGRSDITDFEEVVRLDKEYIEKPEKLADRVERFIKENGYRIKLQYGAFPDRPYDSKAIWGNDTKIRKIMENQTN